VVESRLPKPLVAGSIPVSRSRFQSRLSFQNLTVHTVQQAMEIRTKKVKHRRCMRSGRRGQVAELKALLCKQFGLLEIAKTCK
jgi:hypothetical protein